MIFSFIYRLGGIYDQVSVRASALLSAGVVREPRDVSAPPEPPIFVAQSEATRAVRLHLFEKK